MNKRLFTGVVFLVSLCLIVGQSYACPILKAVISPPKPKWVHQGYTIGFNGIDSIGSIVGCTWSLPPEAYDITYHTHRYPDDMVSCKFSTPGVYTVTLTVTDSEQRTDSDMCPVNVVAVNMVPGSYGWPYPNVYIAFNYDDDDSDGVPDRDQGGTVAGEDDLFEIQLSVAPTDLPGEVELTVLGEGSYTCLKVWSDPDKQNLIIPNGDPPIRYYARWSPAELPPLLYVEGFDVTPVWDAWLLLYYVAPDWGMVYPWDEADFTVVEVDVDMDGVKDFFYQWPGVTEEIIPGGFIALNDDDDNNNEIPDKDEDGPVSGEDDLVKITLRKVLPTNLTGNVTLKKVPSDSTKIKIWENETKGGTPLSLPAIYETPSGLPEELWVEGFEVSSSARDITLAMEYSIASKTFEDKIKITVAKVENVCLFSGNAIESPICFEGGKFELGNPCTGEEQSLIIPHFNVRSLSDPSVIRDFTVGLEAFFLPDLDLPDFPGSLQDADKWSKVAGPYSGYLDDIKELHAKYKNPKKGGVYELEFELPGYDPTRTKSLLHLPLAGPHATDWTLGEKAAVLAFGDRLAILEYESSTGTRVVFFRDGIAWFIASIGLDWDREANQSGRSPCHIFGTNETVTIASVVVDRGKFQDMMWGAFTRRVYGTDYEIIKKSAVLASRLRLLFSPDTPATIEAYNAGRDLTDGIAIATVMENHGYKMQEPGSLAEKLWPSEDPYLGGIIRNDYIDMSTTQLVEVFITAYKEATIEIVEGIWDWF